MSGQFEPRPPRRAFPHFGLFGTGERYGWGALWNAGIYHASRPLAVNLLRPAFGGK